MEQKKKNLRPSGRVHHGSVYAANERYEKDTAEREDLLEGKNAVWEALCAGRQLDKLFFASGSASSVGRIIDRARKQGVPVQECDRRKLDRMSATGAHQGIIAVAAAAQYASIADILALAKNKGEVPLVILCDGITDPHNLGAIIRSAEVAGAHGVVIPRRRSAGLNGACAKAAAGALEHLPVARVSNLPAAMAELKENGLFLFAADMAGVSLYETDLTVPAGIVIGSEGAGLSRLVREGCDAVVSIPQHGHIPSLNASNAAAVLLFETVRQRGVR